MGITSFQGQHKGFTTVSSRLFQATDVRKVGDQFTVIILKRTYVMTLTSDKSTLTLTEQGGTGRSFTLSRYRGTPR
jgi:hypothetical protein